MVIKGQPAHGARANLSPSVGNRFLLRIIIAQLRHRAGRSLAVVSAVMLATTGFCVLTGATTASRLQAVGVVQANYRSAYDILVRPAGTRGELETRQGLVRPNFLSGQFGGLSLDQWRNIQAINGVEIAAPVPWSAMSASISACRWTSLIGSTDGSGSSCCGCLRRRSPIEG
ncbi:hypothetical protein [Micromonospora zamorensis]|uniref:hypothetical protein n=1 Tax=Micromonospora zamorensis TaxID=709883 RepID=UPI002E2A1248|nr:hypothetical protein [Micromonospora zamorensis]